METDFFASTYNLVGSYLLMGDFLKNKTPDVQVYVIISLFGWLVRIVSGSFT